MWIIVNDNKVLKEGLAYLCILLDFPFVPVHLCDIIESSPSITNPAIRFWSLIFIYFSWLLLRSKTELFVTPWITIYWTNLPRHCAPFKILDKMRSLHPFSIHLSRASKYKFSLLLIFCISSLLLSTLFINLYIAHLVRTAALRSRSSASRIFVVFVILISLCLSLFPCYISTV